MKGRRKIRENLLTHVSEASTQEPFRTGNKKDDILISLVIFLALLS